jgi:hypothetical protein
MEPEADRPTHRHRAQRQSAIALVVRCLVVAAVLLTVIWAVSQELLGHTPDAAAILALPVGVWIVTMIDR